MIIDSIIYNIKTDTFLEIIHKVNFHYYWVTDITPNCLMLSNAHTIENVLRNNYKENIIGLGHLKIYFTDIIIVPCKIQKYSRNICIDFLQSIKL